MTQNSINTNNELQQILHFCKHIARAAPIKAISLLGEPHLGEKRAKTTIEVILVIQDYPPRVMSYVKTIGGRTILIFAVDQWVFERDVERGFLGEALASALIWPYTALHGKDYLYTQEIMLKKRLILELLANLVQNFPELSYSLQIKPEYFAYEVMLNRIRIFPLLTPSHAKLLSSDAPSNTLTQVLQGYIEALKQLEKEGRIIFSNGYVMLHKKFVAANKNPKVRLANLSKNAPRALFTSGLKVLPQLLNLFSQNTEALLNFQRFASKNEADLQRLIDPQKFVFVPTAQGLVSLAHRIDINTFVKKILLNGKEAEITLNRVGGVLNDVYLIKASSNGAEKKIILKQFKDWSGFKWFPLALWSFGARSFAVLGRARLERECAISERLRCEGFNVPKILYVNHKERMIFMEYIEGKDLSRTIKRIATSDDIEKALYKIMAVGEIFAHVHALDVALGDTKPENIICTSDDKIYLLDFEQATHGGDKAWDLAEFLYYSGHYLPPLRGVDKAEALAAAFIKGYLKGGGYLQNVKRAGASKYTRVFSVFTLPSVLLSMSKVCRNAERTEANKHG